MKLPLLNELPTTRQMIDVFGGYNHNLRIGEGEFYDMKNLSSDDYPVLSPRRKRGSYATPEKPSGLLAKDALCYVDGKNIVIGDDTIDMELSTNEAMLPKTLISMGAYIIIMPDKKYINTKDHSDRGAIDANYADGGVSTPIHFENCKLDGSFFQPTIQAKAPTSHSDGDYWVDTSSTQFVLKQWSETKYEWVNIDTTYVRISFRSGKDLPFVKGDGVTISGITQSGLTSFNGRKIIQEAGTNYIVIEGIMGASRYCEDNISIINQMPEMDFVIESGNRLWGCRYGLDLNGNFVNEIYASKLGDFKNWNSFDGISTDSYTASLGTDGEFTGAINYLGSPIFFKETVMHKVYGNYPANYRIQDTACRGVQKGCSKSLAIVNEVIYYKSRTSVCAYDGSLPTEISSAFGDVSYFNATAGALGNKYYISMSDSSDMWHLFAFDTLRGLWHREDDTQATDFCNCRGDLYYIDHADNQIKTVKGTGVLETSPISWEAVTGVIGTDSPDKKYISRLDVRMLLTVGTRVYIYIEYDSCGKWEHMFTMTGTKLQSFAVPIRPRRCDHMRLRIIGNGEAKIYSICKTIEQGSDI